MSETVRVQLEVVAAPTFTLTAKQHRKGGVIGDDVEVIVECGEIGGFSSDVEVTMVGAPAGANVSYSPSDRKIAPGESLTVTIDTDGCSEGVSWLDFSGEVVGA